MARPPVLKNFFGDVLYFSRKKSEDYAETMERAVSKGVNLSLLMVAGHLCQANLKGARLVGMNLSEYDATHTIFTKANLKRAHLIRSELSFADFQGALMLNCHIKSCWLRGADFRNANLKAATLIQVDLRGADLRNVKFDENTDIDLRNTDNDTKIDDSLMQFMLAKNI